MAGETPADDERNRPEIDCILANAEWVVTCDGEMRCIPSGAVAIEGDTIVAAGPTDEVDSLFRGRWRMDLHNHILLPGLINTHTHAAMSCFRGLSDDLPLLRWLHEVIFPAERACVSPELVYWGTLLSAVEMLLNGTTTFCDGYFFEEAAARAALHSGMRAVLGQGILDFPTPDQPEPHRFRERAETFLEHFPEGGGDRLRPSLFCHALFTCGPQTIQEVKALCRERKILFQMHLSESAPEVERHVKEHGQRPVPYLDGLGVLDGQSLFIHGVWLDAGEILILGERGAGLSHNPESNMKLASGVAPVPELLAAGVNVGLGTDGCASNNDLDLFTEMDRAAKLQKVFRNDPVVCSAPGMLHMATRGGACALGWGDAIGSLEPGKKADIIAIDVDQPHLTPLYDPVSHLVYAARGSDVRHVWVNGRRLVADGRIVHLDVAEVMDRVRKMGGEIARNRNTDGIKNSDPSIYG